MTSFCSCGHRVLDLHIYLGSRLSSRNTSNCLQHSRHLQPYKPSRFDLPDLNIEYHHQYFKPYIPRICDHTTQVCVPSHKKQRLDQTFLDKYVRVLTPIYLYQGAVRLLTNTTICLRAQSSILDKESYQTQLQPALPSETVNPGLADSADQQGTVFSIDASALSLEGVFGMGRSRFKSLHLSCV